MKSLAVLILFTTASFSAYSFDLEDYATTYRATRDAYIKAANELELAIPVVENRKQLLEDSCYTISGADFANLKGLRSGSCAADGKSAYSSGGVYRSGVSLGDQLGDLINMTPSFVKMPSITDLIQWSDEHASANTVNNDLWKKDPGSAGIKITRVKSCSQKNKYINDKNIADMILYFNYSYDAYRKAAREVQLAIGPLKAAQEAYTAATTVYTMGIGCESQIGSQNADLYDAYVPVEPDPEPAPE
jgi:hypothetical protein